MKLLVKKLTNFIGIDNPVHRGDAGYDVYSTIDIRLGPQERRAVPLGVALEFSEGWVCRVEQKSGLAVQHGLTTIGNVIDSQYRGEIHAILVNISNFTVYIYRGMKVAQLVFYQCKTPKIQFTDSLSVSDRGENRFGSTEVR